MPTSAAKKLTVVEIGEKGSFGVLLPTKHPGVLQFAVQDKKGRRTVIEMPSSWRRGIAMELLRLDGAQVNVELRWPQPKAIDVECPKCGATAGNKCRRRDGLPAKRYHKERTEAARRAPWRGGTLDG